MTRSFDLFLSHNAGDKPVVAKIAARLLDEFSIRCWLDAWDLRAGTDWNQAVEQALGECRACAIFLSAAGWGDAHLQEARTALQIGRTTPEFRTIPVLLPGASPEAMAVLGEVFEKTHRIEIRDQGDDEAVRRLASAVRGETHGPPIMTAFTIRRDAQRWSSSPQRDHSLLYRGTVLRNAQRIAVNDGSDLDAVAFRFLAAGEEEERRQLDQERKRNRRVVTTLLSLIGGLTLAVLFAVLERKSAEDQAYVARSEQQIASTRRGVAERQREVADSQRRAAEHHMSRASAANLLELAQRLQKDEPLPALRLAAEAMVRVPDGDAALRERVLASLVEMIRSGRLSKVASSAERPLAVGDTDFFIVNEADRSALRRRGDGSFAAVLPFKVTAVISDEQKASAERVPWFIVDYGGLHRRELRRKRDGALVTRDSVESVRATGTRFGLVRSSFGDERLLDIANDRIAIPLTGKRANVTLLPGAEVFIVGYDEATFEIRAAETGALIETVPAKWSNQNGVAGMSSDRRLFALNYFEKTTRGGVHRVALFEANGRRVDLPDEPRAIVFSPSSNAYAVLFEHRGELRHTERNTVVDLPRRVARCDFAGRYLIVGYHDGQTEIRDSNGKFMSIHPQYTRVSAIPGTSKILAVVCDTAEELLDLRTGARVPISTGASAEILSGPPAEPLQYMVVKRSRPELSYDIYSLTTGNHVLSATEVVASPATAWVLALTPDRRLYLFDRKDGTKIEIEGIDVNEITRSWVRLHAWPGVPAMVVGTEPSQIRKVSAGALLSTLPDRVSGAELSPDGKMIDVDLEHWVRFVDERGGQADLVRTDAALVDATTGWYVTRTGARNVRYTARGRFAYGGKYVYDLRARAAIERLKGVQVDDGGHWFAVQHEDLTSELWYDGGPSAATGRVARLRDGATLICADASGKRVILWEPDGGVFLVAGDLLTSLDHDAPSSPKRAIQMACEMLKTMDPQGSEIDGFVLGEPARACTASSFM